MITGSARFLGAAVAKKLSDQKKQLILLDNLSVGDYQNIRMLTSQSNVTFINTDITKGIPQSIREVEYILHLAATNVNYGKTPLSNVYDLSTNSTGTQNLLELAERTGARFVYASSILLYRSPVEDIRRTVKEEISLYAHLDAKRFGESLVQEYGALKNIDTRIVRLPHLYGLGMNLANDQPLGSILERLVQEDELVLRGDGTDKHYYLHINDAADGLIRATLSPKGKGLIIPLVTPKQVTQLDIVKTLSVLLDKKIIDETKAANYHDHFTPIDNRETLEIIGWEPIVSLKEGLTDTIRDLQKAKAADEYSTPVKQITAKKEKQAKFKPTSLLKIKKLPSNKIKLRKVPKIKRAKLLPFLILSFIIGCLLAPPSTIIYHTSKGVKYLTAAQNSLQVLDFDEATNKGNLAKSHFRKATKSVQLLTKITNPLHRFNQLQLTKRLLTASNLAATALISSCEGASIITEPLLATLPTLATGTPPEKPITLSNIQTASSHLKLAKNSLALAEAELKTINSQKLPEILASKAEETAQDILTARHQISNFLTITQSLPALLGFNQPTTLLILLQNSNELRASGGFIGSFAQVKFENGYIAELRIDDIYNPDGALIEQDIKIDPPEPIKNILGQPRWFLRDANWDADFTEAVEDIRQFYLLETGVSLDGVLAIDLFAMENLLKVIGPLKLSTYNEEITQDNLFEKTELYSEAGFLPGANYKKTFIAALGQQMVNGLAQMDKVQYAQLISTLNQTLNEKHILLNFKIPTLQTLALDNNWAGEIKGIKTDFVYVVDSNLGANKVDYYITRTKSYEVSQDSREGTMAGKIILNYIHTGTSTAWPGGKYNNFVRILVPEGSRLTQASQTRSDLEEKNTDITETITISTEAGKTVFARLIELDPGQSVTLTLTYLLPPQLAITPDKKAYNLTVVKQPGINEQPLLVTIITPFGREVSQTLPSMDKIGNNYRLSINQREDLQLSVALN